MGVTALDLTRQIEDLRRQILAEEARHKQTYDELDTTLAKARSDRKISAMTISPELVDLAETIIEVQGDFAKHRDAGEGGSIGVVRDAIADLADPGLGKLPRSYKGLKQYDRWYGQREDHDYGHGRSSSASASRSASTTTNDSATVRTNAAA